MKKLHQRLRDQSEWYRRWHTQDGHHLVHWAVFILFAVAALAVVTTKIVESSDNGLAGVLSALTQEDARGLTNELLQEVRTLPTAAPLERPAKLDKLVKAATRREAAMARDLAANPKKFLLNSMPDEVFAKFPPEVKAHLEKHAEVTGTVRSMHYDTEDGGEVGETYYLFSDSVRDDPAPLKIHLASGKGLAVGNKVKLKGVLLGQNIVLAEASTETIQVLAAYIPPTVSPEHKVLAILMNFSDNPTSQPFTPAQISGKLFTDASSVSNYYTEQSYGAIHFSGAVTPWITISASSGTCDPMAWKTASQAAAKNAGYDAALYQHVIYFFPHAAACGWSGLGSVPGKDSWINGSNSLHTFSHELGHNLRSHHAAALSCGMSAVSANYSADCQPLTSTTYAYGDHYDVMGIGAAQEAPHFNAAHKYQVGFLSPSAIQTVTTSGTYTLHMTEAPSTGLQALRIPKNSIESYYVGYRQNVGFDANLPAGITRGAEIVIWDDNNPWTSDFSQKTLKIDTSPNPDGTNLIGDFVDASLSDGATFTDGKVTIKQLSHDLGAHTVTLAVTIDGTATPVCIKSNPSIAVNPISASGAPGQTRSYGVTVTNNNSASCPASTYHVAPTASPAGFTTAVTQSDITVASGTSGATTLTVTSPVTALDAVYQVTLAASDVANAAANASSALTYMVSSPPPVLPAAPTNLSASTVVSPASITLKWTDNSTTETKFAVLRSTNHFTTNTVFFTAANVTSYTDTDVTLGTTYEYKVTAGNDAGLSPDSNMVAATITSGTTDSVAPSIPTGLKAVPSSSSSITLSWGASTDPTGGSGLKGYGIYRNGALLKTTTGTAVTYLDSGLTATTAYSYAVSAVDMAGNESAKSASVSATIPATPTVDSTKPTVAMTAPVANASVTKKGSVTLTATASDNAGVTKVAFYQGTTLLCTDQTAPYSCIWNVPAPPKTYTLQARAYDAAGNIGVSSSVTVSAK